MEEAYIASDDLGSRLRDLCAPCSGFCFWHCKDVLSIAVDAVGERVHECRVSGRGFWQGIDAAFT
jgi:hypothetical protein